MSDSPRMICSLQGGRALAALAVVVQHAALAADDFGGTLPFKAVFDLGYLGVDFFFVLSGFIIYYSTFGRSKDAQTYVKARLRRIYLPYLPVGVALALAYAALPRISLGQRDWNWLTTATLIPVGAPALAVAWTLQHEMLFYLLFGLFYFSGRLLAGMSLWGLAIASAALWGAPDVVALRPINLEFFFGMGAAMLARRERWRVAMIPAALACFVVWAYLGCDRGLSVLVGLGFALLMPVAVAMERGGRLPVPPALVFLGAASYSIYLTHGLAASFVARVLHGAWPIMIGAALAGVIGGVAYYLAVERPLLRCFPWEPPDRARR